MFFFFFFNDTATTEIYTLSLHDALPISQSLSTDSVLMIPRPWGSIGFRTRGNSHLTPKKRPLIRVPLDTKCSRSEEHTSELQSQSNLVCRLLLEKKKKITISITTTITMH